MAEEEHIGVDIPAIFISIICLICAAFASGLTQGLLSLDQLQLEILKRSGTEAEKKQAAILLPIIAHHHWLIASLMLWNAIAMETLPIFLDKLVPTAVAIVMSVTLILICGEIVPAAIMTGPHQLYIVSNLQYLTWGVLFILSPIAYPIAKALDYILGVDEGITPFNRRQLSEMIKIQHEEHMKTGKNAEHNVNQAEVTMIDGVLKFKDILVSEIMTVDVFMLSIDEKLSFNTLNKIFKSGYSRIPIFDTHPHDVVGLILTKDLLFIDPDDDIPIRSFTNLFCRPIQSVWPDQKLGEVLQLFRQTRGHMAIVRDVDNSGDLDPRNVLLGIVTLEDVFECMLGDQIMDETDSIDENNRVVKDRNRDVELMRMAILNPSLRGLDQRLALSEEEVRVVTAHFCSNVPQIAELLSGGESNSSSGGNGGVDVMHKMEQLVRQSTLVEVKKVLTSTNITSTKLNSILATSASNGSLSNSNSTPDASTSALHVENALYRKGKVSNSAILILSGKVTVFAGTANFRAEVGPWTILAPEALMTSGDSSEEYMPDFSAYVESAELRYLLISKLTIQEIINSTAIPPHHDEPIFSSPSSSSSSTHNLHNNIKNINDGNIKSSGYYGVGSSHINTITSGSVNSLIGSNIRRSHQIRSSQNLISATKHNKTLKNMVDNDNDTMNNTNNTSNLNNNSASSSSSSSSLLRISSNKTPRKAYHETSGKGTNSNSGSNSTSTESGTGDESSDLLTPLLTDSPV